MSAQAQLYRGFRVRKIGIIGCGFMGTEIAMYAQRHFRKKARIVSVCDIDIKKAEGLSFKIKPHPKINDIETLIRKSDLVVECASKHISGKVAKLSVSHKKDVLIMSSGGLLRQASLFNKAKSRGCKIYIPSGAICGLDGLVSAGIGKIKSVTLTTRKPIKGFKGAVHLKNVNLDKIKRETILYSGNAIGAIKNFPQNINVAVTLSLFGIGPRKTKVKIITSPMYKRNIHEILVEGEFGRLLARTENVPSKKNPKTSQLALYSAIAKLKEVL